MSIKEGSVMIILFLFDVIVLILLEGITDMESEKPKYPGHEVLLGGWSERNSEENEIQ
ncbi:hypothetical protein LOAG_02386, partial [Loa loa]